jgi:hypothetical protein
MRVEKVLALLIESGFVYCCIWVCATTAEGTNTCVEAFITLMQILYIISVFGVFPEPGFTVMDSILVFVAVGHAR